MTENLSELMVTLAEQGKLTRLCTFLSDLNGTEMDEFRRGWVRLSAGQHEGLVRTLVSMAEDDPVLDFRPIFRWLLGDPNPVVRTAAIEGLWEDETPALIGPLLYLLQHDEDVRVREAAAISLGRYVLQAELGDLDVREATPVVEALLQTVYDQEEDLDVRRRALESLAYAGEPAVRDLIEAAYYHSDTRMQVSALFAMGRSADQSWEPFILAEFQSPDPELRYEAALAAGELELITAVRYLSDLVYDEDVDVRMAAIEALGRIGGPEAERLLLSLLESEDEAVVAAVEDALEELQFVSGVRDFPLLDYSLFEGEDGGAADIEDDINSLFEGTR